MLDTYVQAFFPPPATVLKKQLRTFSLGHSFILEAIRNPFEVGGIYTIKELVQFVWVCSRTFDEAVSALANDDICKEELHEWHGQISGINFLDECTKAEEYKAAALAIPQRWKSDSESGRRTVIPWQIAVFQSVRGDGAVSTEIESNIWNMPLGRAIAYSTARAWANGDDSFVSEEDEQAAAALDEYEAREANA